MLLSVAVLPKPAYALFGVGDISFTTVTADIPGMIWRAVDKGLKIAVDTQFRNQLNRFLNNLAYNTATKIATGESGQKPLFFNLKEVLNEAVDQSVGEFSAQLLTATSGGGKCLQTGQACVSDTQCPLIARTTGEFQKQSKEAVDNGLSLPYDFTDNTFSHISFGTSSSTDFDILVGINAVVPNSLQRDKCQREAAGGFAGIDICRISSPAAEIRIKTLVAETVNAPAPRCTFRQLADNFSDLRNIDTGGLIRVSDQFSSRSNEIGVILNLSTSQEEKRSAAIAQKNLEVIAGKGIKAVEDKVTGETKTPPSFVEKATEESLFNTPFKSYLNQTGSLVADALGVFTNTLASKLLKQVFDKGFNPATDSSYAYNRSGFFGGLSGITAARVKFADLLKVDDIKRNQQDAGTLLQTLASGCDIGASAGALSTIDPDAFRDTSNCVIDESFRFAIEQKLSVQQALDQGLLDGLRDFAVHNDGTGDNALAGSSCTGCDPSVYSLRSIQVLRKYRIVPVGWELAGRYITEILQQVPGTDHSYKLDDVINAYTDAGSPFYHLVDPNWQLKAPLAISEVRGPGEKIISEQFVYTEDTNEDGRVDRRDDPQRLITRSTQAADEQTCIFETADGECLHFGYCVEERPIWRINGDECADGSVYDSCQTFIRASDQSNVSYIEKSVDKASCIPSVAGCREYSLSKNPLTLDWITGTNQGDTIYLDRDAPTCNAQSVGCNEYLRLTNISDEPLSSDEIRTILTGVQSGNGDIDSYREKAIVERIYLKSGGGQSNVIKNGGFEDGMNGWIVNGSASVSTAHAFTGTQSAQISLGSNTHVIHSEAIPVTGSTYRVSARFFDLSDKVKLWVIWNYVADGNTLFSSTGSCPGGLCWGAESANGSNAPGVWTQVSREVTIPAGAVEFHVTVGVSPGGSGSAYVDDIRVERVVNTGLACSESDVLCREYSPNSYAGPDIPGVITPVTRAADGTITAYNDECPSDCVGYQTYDEAEYAPLGLTAQTAVPFIASTAQQCTAAAEGCTEFTNLNDVAGGGEGIEYYSALRYCVPQNDPSAETFFTWEGSEDTGFQLRTWSLQASGGQPVYAPGTPAPSSADCSSSVYNLPPDHPDANPDCREYLRGDPASGNITRVYRLHSRVVFATDECEPLRGNINGTSTLLSGLPSLSKSCRAVDVGCRRYQGSNTGNTRTIFNTNFESGSNEGWTGPSVGISSESLTLGGRSLAIQGPQTITRTIDDLQRKNYILRFWAKGQGSLTAEIRNSTGVVALGTSAALTDQWNEYVIGPANITFEPTGSEEIAITGWTGSSPTVLHNLDTIELVESDDLYLIQDSWSTPAICDDPTVGAQLYCEEYRDDQGKQRFIKSFTNLCNEAFIGCEALVQTFNSDTSVESRYQEDVPDDIRDTVVVPADSIVYAVNNSTFACEAVDVGCTEVGKTFVNRDNQSTYTTEYRILDPDEYDTSLCRVEYDLCEEYSPTGTNSGGFPIQFKNPQDRTCEFRRNVSISDLNTAEGQAIFTGWFKTDATSTRVADICLLEGENTPRVPSICNFQTIGDGYQFVEGLDNSGSYASESGCYSFECPSDQSSCRQYQDPVNPPGCDKQALPGSPNACDYYYFLKDTLQEGQRDCQGQVDPRIGCVGFYETDKGDETKYLRADCQPGCRLIRECYNPINNTFGNACTTNADCASGQYCGGVPVREFPNCSRDERTTDPNSKPGCQGI